MKNLLENILKLLFNLTNWLQKEIRTRYKSQNIIINTLAPKVLTEVEDVKRIKPYLDSLKAAIDTDNINNIAITGSYGSGKSTIIKTFQNRHPEYEYLNISLASFSDNKGDEEIERKLEISILQQMFYHVKPSDIPDSRFKRIVNLTNKHLVIHALLLIVWSLSALILIKFKYIDKLNPSTWNVNYDFDLVTFLSTSIFFVGIGFFIKSVYRLFSNSKINKLNIKGELELGEAVDKSVFNQHLEEILYFFERKKYNVVVIEDVDRFNSTDIFTKLREINILINSSKLINRSVKFVYAIKDEMFLDKNDRVKFFEFIIPVISFINPGNANDQLEKLINDANLQGQLSSSFTSDIVTFIDDIDMRLLINIFQEFQIYRNILSNSLSADKLFAILVYKNMYPDDYGELAKRKGKLYRFLTNKKEYIKDLLREIELKIDGIGKHIAFLEKEELASVEELRAVYINCLVAKLKNFQSFYFGTNVSIADAVKEEYFRQLQDGITYIEFAKDRYSDRYSLSDSPVKADKKLSDIEKEVNPSLTYSQREKLLFDKKNNATETLKKEREHLLKTSQGVLAYSIQEVFTSKDIAPYLGDFSNSYLMRNLLLNGHIDEHYEDYTTLFHGVSITQADFEFERHVKSGINSPPDYGLSKIENLIKKLPVRYFKGEAIWNYALLDWLLNNHNKYKDKLDFFYEGLKDNSEKQFKFINSYIKRNPAKLASFIANLCYTKPGLWQYIDSKSGLPADEIRSLVKLIFEYAKKESILGFDNVKQLEAYIKKMPDFFAFCASLNHSHVIQAFVVERSLKIEKLDLPTDAQKQIFGDVYNKNAYTINEHNLVAILKGNGIDYNLEEFEKSQYTTIQKLDLKPLQEYISSDICDYVINVMTTSKGNQYEAEKTILDILNREDIKESVKEKLLESQSTLIQDINSITEVGIQQLALSQQSILPSWANVFAYYDKTEKENFDDTLIEFLNEPETYESLSIEDFQEDNNREEDYFKKISKMIVHCDTLKIEAYSNLLSALPYTYNKIEYTELDSTRIYKLLEKSKLNLTSDNFSGLKSIDAKLSLLLVEFNQSDLLDNSSNIPLKPEDWAAIFKSSIISQKNKLLLLDKIDDSHIVGNNDIADAVCSMLPSDKLIPLRYEVLDAMFKAHASVQKRIELLLLHSFDLETSQIQSLAERLGVDYANVFVKQHNPKFKNALYNRSLFDMLKARDLIKRYKLEEKERQIRVIAKDTE